MGVEHFKNIIETDRHDIANALLDLGKKDWSNLAPDLRAKYENRVTHLRRIVAYFDYLLECCERWPTAPPGVTSSEMSLELTDGLDWPEALLNEGSNSNLPADFLDYISKCSRWWRLEQNSATGT